MSGNWRSIIRGRIRGLRRGREHRRRIAAGRLHWNIRISAPDDPSSRRWGDTAFAEDLADALARLGQRVDIQFLGGQAARQGYDVTLVLRGLHRLAPDTESTVNYLWVISHPDAVSADETAAAWTRIFAASESWSPGPHVVVEPLLQASSARRFAPGPADERLRADVLFVGTSRGIVRPVIRDAVAVGADLAVYGHDWEGRIPDTALRADHLPFAEVPAAYRSARIVLNDHWDDMRRHGFVSNRLFDATASGARVVSDSIEGIDELFRGLVRTYSSADELRGLLTEDAGWPSAEDARRISERVRTEHSFDARARRLLSAALSDIRS